MKHLISLLFLFFTISGFTQQQREQRYAINRLAHAPDSVFRTTSSFSHYLKSVYKNDEQMLEAIYVWIAKSVAYDVDNMYNINFEEKPEELIARTFRSRKAICQGYSELFNDICRKCGINSYVVHGYTMQSGRVKNSGHSWVVASTGKRWYCFDPTWGAGYIYDDKFYRSFTFDYFMINPEEFIASHMPFDPIWQCLIHPVSVENFYKMDVSEKEGERIFSFADSIKIYEKLSVIGQYEATLKRMESCGIHNEPTREYFSFLQQSIENDRLNRLNAYQSQMIDKLNEATDHFNSAANLFNRYISYFNRQFTPVRSDADIRHMIDTCETRLIMAKQFIVQVDPCNSTITQATKQLNSLIRNLQSDLNEQKIFVNRYLRTPKGSRARLFVK